MSDSGYHSPPGSRPTAYGYLRAAAPHWDAIPSKEASRTRLVQLGLIQARMRGLIRRLQGGWWREFRSLGVRPDFADEETPLSNGGEFGLGSFWPRSQFERRAFRCELDENRRQGGGH